MTIKTILSPSYQGDLLALIAGLLLVLGFAPFNIYPIGFIAPAILLASWLYVKSWRAFWRGWLFGLGLFGGGLYWVYISIHTYGKAPAILAVLLTLLLAAVLALFPAFTGYLVTRLFPRNGVSKFFRGFPVFWALLEWVRSWVFTGFPWLLLGYTQTNLPTWGYATVFGVLGLSIFTAVNSGALVYFFLTNRRGKLLTIYHLALSWAVAIGLTYVHWTQPFGKPISVALVQGNIAQTVKWSPEQVQPTIDTYMKLSKPYWDKQLEIWPEAAIPLPLDDAEPMLNDIKKTIVSHNSALITGIPIENVFKTGYYNAAIALGDAHGTYLKRHLVPFGEYFPLGGVSKYLLSKLDIPMSDMTPGAYYQPNITLGKVHFATMICYEIIFPELVRAIPPNTNAIVSLSDDAWFGHSIAQAQHLQIAQMRAKELGRPILFSTNNGMTAIVNARGEITDEAKPFTATVLTGEVQPMQGQTFWYTAGMDVTFFLMLIMITYGLWRRNKEPHLT